MTAYSPFFKGGEGGSKGEHPTLDEIYFIKLLDELYILGEYRGVGVGTKVLEFITEFCNSLGIKAIHLVVERKNNTAHSLYRKMGFADCDRDIMTKWINT